jgi:hypothetical protein
LQSKILKSGKKFKILSMLESAGIFSVKAFAANMGFHIFIWV